MEEKYITLDNLKHFKNNMELSVLDMITRNFKKTQLATYFEVFDSTLLNSNGYFDVYHNLNTNYFLAFAVLTMDAAPFTVKIDTTTCIVNDLSYIEVRPTYYEDPNNNHTGQVLIVIIQLDGNDADNGGSNPDPVVPS